jgi:hypothetical protein
MRIPGISSLERRRHRLISHHRFAARMLMAVGLWCILAVVGLAIGMAGYAGFEGMSLADAYVNAAMILSGMGPMGELKTTAGKVFAGFAEIGGIEPEKR